MRLNSKQQASVLGKIFLLVVLIAQQKPTLSLVPVLS